MVFLAYMVSKWTMTFEKSLRISYSNAHARHTWQIGLIIDNIITHDKSTFYKSIPSDPLYDYKKERNYSSDTSKCSIGGNWFILSGQKAALLKLPFDFLFLAAFLMGQAV